VSPGQVTGLGSCFATADTENRERLLRIINASEVFCYLIHM